MPLASVNAAPAAPPVFAFAQVFNNHPKPVSIVGQTTINPARANPVPIFPAVHLKGAATTLKHLSPVLSTYIWWLPNSLSMAISKLSLS
jgi:hypothetical protein